MKIKVKKSELKHWLDYMDAAEIYEISVEKMESGILYITGEINSSSKGIVLHKEFIVEALSDIDNNSHLTYVYITQENGNTTVIY